MTKKGYKEIPVEQETYDSLQQRAQELDITIDEYVLGLVRRLLKTPIDEVLKVLKGGKA